MFICRHTVKFVIIIDHAAKVRGEENEGQYDLNIFHMALQEVKRGNTLRDVAEHYDISKYTLGKYRNLQDLTTINIGAGRKTKAIKRG